MRQSPIRVLVWMLLMVSCAEVIAGGLKYPPPCDLDDVIRVIERRLAEQEREWHHKRQEVDAAARRTLGRALSEQETETRLAPARSADETDTVVAPALDSLDPPFGSISADANLPSGQDNRPTLMSPGVPISIPKAPRVPSFHKKKPPKPGHKKSVMRSSEKTTQPADPPTEQAVDTSPPSSSGVPTVRAQPRDENQLPTLRSED